MATTFQPRKRNGFILFLMALLSGTTALQAGEYAADFTRIGVGARAMAMGGAQVAIANDASASYWNPAGSGGQGHGAIQFEHMPMFDGLAHYNTASVRLAFNPQTSVSLNWIRLGVDDIPRYDALHGSRLDRYTTGAGRSDGTPLGYFSDREDALFMSFRRSMLFDLTIGGDLAGTVLPAELSFGVSGKYLQQKLDGNSASGQGLDAGMLLRLMPGWQDEPEPLHWVGIGAAVHDLSRTQLSWNTATNHKDAIGRGLQAGVAACYTWTPLRLRITAGYDRLFWSEEGNRAGAELTFFKVLSIRGGYYRSELTAGAGLELAGFCLDYAFIGGDLGNSHRITGAFRF
ncbi:MAG TPA: hypothetical protein PLG50_11535 [bacterium]|nr:hypothetical protein [bacterium]HQG46280.1 hypothetical protein [bacterium]HQI48573.1 hypothetical protein [bacterium]HQJ64029.1 hypothetical protein [bacterium]